jgi:hypothetical protein
VIPAAILLVAAAEWDAAVFAPWFAAEGVEVSIARAPDGPPWVRGVAELETPPGSLAALLTDYARYGSLFAPFVARAALLERLPDGARLHVVWRYPFPFRNRDAVVRYEAMPQAGDGFRIAWRGDDRPGDPRSGVRIARVAGETRIERLAQGRSRVTYTYLGDLGGRFPRNAEERAWRREPLEYMAALRRGVGLAPRKEQR